MTARLFCKVGELRGSEFSIGDEATIGRGADNDVVLGRGLVSSRHARIYFDRDRGAYYVEDLGSLNGTRLDGIALTRPERLGDLAVLTFAGKFDFVFQDLGALPVDAKPAVGHRTMIEREPVLPPELLAGGGGPAPARVPTGKTIIERQAPVLPEALGPEAASGDEDEDGVPRGTWIETDWVAVPAALGGEAEAGPPAAAEPEAEAEASAGAAAADSGPREQAIAAAEAQPAADAEPPAEVEPEADRSSPAAAGSGGPSFVLEAPDLEGRLRRFTLRPGDNVVGRYGDCQLQLDNPSVSRHHAVLTLAGGRVTVRDLGSSNHTYLGDDLVEGEVEVPAGATLRFGAVAATIVAE